MHLKRMLQTIDVHCAGVAWFALLLAFRKVATKFLSLAAFSTNVLVDRLMADPVRRTWYDLRPTRDLFRRPTGDHHATSCA